MKRHNPYSVEDVMLKHSLSRREAEIKIASLKERTTLSLENFIRKYGDEEGRKRWDSFRFKSSHTFEKFKEKYEEKAELKWKEYLKSKESRSEEYFKKKYGDDGWEEKRNELIAKWSHSVSLEGMVERYGEEEGRRKHSEIQRKKANTLETFKGRYGEEEGERRYLEYVKSKDCMSEEYFKKKYGEKWEEERLKARMVRSSSFHSWVEDLGIEEARKLWLKMYNSKPPRNSKGWGGRVSKISFDVFSTLEKFLGEELKYGNGKEKCLVDRLGRKRYFDCVIEKLKLIIEYNGSHCHYRPDFGRGWVSKYGYSAFSALLRDARKRKLANENGYDIIYIWDDEVSSAKRTHEMIERVRKYVSERKANFENPTD